MKLPTVNKKDLSRLNEGCLEKDTFIKKCKVKWSRFLENTPEFTTLLICVLGIILLIVLSKYFVVH